MKYTIQYELGNPHHGIIWEEKIKSFDTEWDRLAHAKEIFDKYLETLLNVRHVKFYFTKDNGDKVVFLDDVKPIEVPKVRTH